MTRDVVSRVIRRLHATTPEELYEIGGWAHDAYFAWEEVEFDALQRTVVVPFAQQPPDDVGAPRAELVRERRVGGSVFKVPFLRYRLVVRGATRCEIPCMYGATVVSSVFGKETRIRRPSCARSALCGGSSRGFAADPVARAAPLRWRVS
jgi:hypothetical protein